MIKVCITCEKEFYVPPSHLRKTTGSGTHCSNECRQKRTSLTCQNCKNQFIVRLSSIKYNSSKYCSRVCYYEGKKVSREHTLLRTRLQRRKRVARLNNALGDFTIEYFKWLCEQLNNLCVMCSKVFPQGKLTIDHMVAVTKGGKHDNSNIQPLCGRCNAVKGSRIIYQDKRVKELYKQYETN